jgi:hypothetical protein
MDKNKLLMAVAAVALIAGTSGALAQQEPPRSAPAEKMAPKAPAAPKTPASEIHQNTVPSGDAMHNGEADTNRKNAEERSDRTKSNRVREGQTGGRPETTGQAPQERRDNDCIATASVLFAGIPIKLLLLCSPLFLNSWFVISGVARVAGGCPNSEGNNVLS